MSLLADLSVLLERAPGFAKASTALRAGGDFTLGAAPSIRSLIVASAFRARPRATLVVIPGADAAERFARQLNLKGQTVPHSHQAPVFSSARRAMLALCAAFLLAGCQGRSAPPASSALVTGPVAIVVTMDKHASLVDLEKGVVVRTDHVRSFVTEVTADASSGVFVTAQAGGVGTDCDTALGVVDARRGGVRYITLEMPNPCEVDMLPDGRVLAGHGLMDDKGWVKTVVDVSGKRPAEIKWVPDGSQAFSVAAGSLWGLGQLERGHTGEGPLDSVLMKLDPSTIGVVSSWDVPRDSVAVLPDGESTSTILLLTSGRPPTKSIGDGVLARLDASTGRVIKQASIEGLRVYAGSAVAVGSSIVVEDGELGGKKPDGQLIVFDRESLTERRRIKMGQPVDAMSMAAWGDTVLVLGMRTGELLFVDPTTGRVERRVSIPGAGDNRFACVAVIP
jgi:hypothetical protein